MTARHSRRGQRRIARRDAARGLAVGTATTLALGTGALVGMPAAHADTGTQIFDLSSDAVAVESTATDPGVPLGLPFSVGSYGASSLLNSNGESSADAGAPYSPLLFSLPNTGNGVAYSSFGYALPVVPSFPGYVSAKDPITPLAKQNAGGYELVATAAPNKARGQVNVGALSSVSDENNAFAYSDSVSNPDGVTSEAAAGVHALRLTGIMDLANFSSYARLTRGTDGHTVPVTVTDLGTISFAGLTSGLTGKGFTALGSAPKPISADGLDPLNAALKPAGITLTYLPETYTYTDGSTTTGPTVDDKKTVSEVASGALRIFVTNTSSRGTSTETITIGRVAVKATGSTVAGSASTPATAAGTAGAAAPGTALPSTGVDTAGPAAPPTVAGAPPVSGPKGAAPAKAAPTEQFIPVAASSVRIDPMGTTQFDSVYLVLVAAAAVAGLGAQVLRLTVARIR